MSDKEFITIPEPFRSALTYTIMKFTNGDVVNLNFVDFATPVQVEIVCGYTNFNTGKSYLIELKDSVTDKNGRFYPAGTQLHAVEEDMESKEEKVLEILRGYLVFRRQWQ